MPDDRGQDRDWDLDWSHDLLRALYERIQGEYRLELLGSAPDVIEATSGGTKGDPVAFIRHDVDVSIRRAYDLALVEQQWGVRSTYHVMFRSPFYDPARETTALRDIVAAGHEVGLHFTHPDLAAASSPAELEPIISRECDRLAELTGAPVRSLSFHTPPPSALRGPVRLAGRANAYASELFVWYLSDSRARWREGDPLASLDAPRSKILQLLVHPIWWGPENLRPAERLGIFVDEIARSTRQSFEDVAAQVNGHIAYQATKRAGQ